MNTNYKRKIEREIEREEKKRKRRSPEKRQDDNRLVWLTQEDTAGCLPEAGDQR